MKRNHVSTLVAAGSAALLIATLMKESPTNPARTEGGEGNLQTSQRDSSTASSNTGQGAADQLLAQGAQTATSGSTLAPLNKVADLPDTFLSELLVGASDVGFTLPNGRAVKGTATYVKRDQLGVQVVQGKISEPESGHFFFQRQTREGVAGNLVGNVIFDKNTVAWRIEPSGQDGAPQLVQRDQSQLICSTPMDPNQPLSALDTHPTGSAQPNYQPIVPYTSLPGAPAVVYLDFDGEEGPFPGWGQGNPNFDALPSSATPTQVFEIWQRVAEDYLPFNISVTTDRRVFDDAPEGQKMHAIMTPTKTAYPFGAGNALVGSFNWTGISTCWIYNAPGKSAAEAASHEVGHTLGLVHHGRTTPAQIYYQGGGTGVVSWAPIMGNADSANLGHWSKGEYLNANNSAQDDLLIISTQNNAVTYRTDDYGSALATAGYLEIKSDNTVANEGVIETSADLDSFRFETTGGAVSFTVNPALNGPNLDILAELVNASSGTVVVSDNGLDAISATLSTTLSAGEYLLRISGVGRGDPLNADGYSDYSSLGTYKITGSVVGGTKPDRFSVAENSANGASVGTVIPRKNHASRPITFDIVSGNTNGGFAINPTTGAITVANSAALDFESVSSKWDDLPVFELTVTITDTNSSFNESIRVVVSLTNVNESPTVVATNPITILEHTAAGTKLVRVAANDPDALDFPSFSIVSGNVGNVFAIDGLGQITAANEIDLTADTVYNLVVQVSDQGTPALTLTTPVTITALNIPDGLRPGSIVRTYFDSITGSTVADLTGAANFPNSPNLEQFLPSFRGELRGTADFGDTIRGFVIPPVSGNYEFWIAGDDATELWLSTDDNPANAVLIASNATPTATFDWGANPSQHSASISLSAGVAYYIEARHKQGAGDDHVEVAWSGPGISQEIIPGRFLAPFDQNYAPTPNAATYAIRENAVVGFAAGLVTTYDVNGEDTSGGYQIIGGNTGNAFGIDPATGRIFVATAGVLNATTTPSYTLTIQATDNGTPPLTGSGTVTVNVQAATGINKTGLLQQMWTGLTGNTIASLTSSPNYPFSPNSTRNFLDSEATGGGLDNYGSRMRFVVTAPTTGTYNFWVAGDYTVNLLVGTNATAASAVQVANVPSAVGFRNFTTFASQKSANINLVAGQKYYVEAVHKEDTGSDSVSIAWTGPGIATPTLLGSANIAPYDINTAPQFASGSYSFLVNPGAAVGTNIGSTLSTDPEGDAPTYAITSGNGSGAFSINATTGAISVANSAPLTSFSVFNLQVTIQDNGIGAIYPLKSAVVAVTITVPGPNVAPTWTADPISKAAANANNAYTGSTLAGEATDLNPGDTLSYSKESGPAWLVVNSSGGLSGVPSVSDLGVNSFQVRVTDSGGLFAIATLNITVTNTNHPPIWSGATITKSAGTIGLAYAGSVAGDASDPDIGDVLTFSKISGPAWLTVAGNGALSGTPALTDVGNNTWSVRVTDAGGLSGNATLQIAVGAAALPSPWTSSDIGSTGKTGATLSEGGGAYSQAGAGAGISGTADALQFASQPLAGDGEIRVRVSSLSGGTSPSAGVMLRESTAAGSRTVFVGINGSNIVMKSRSSTGGSVTTTTNGAINPAPDNWVRLSRDGNIVNAYRSIDGVTWTSVGTVSVSFPTNVIAGIVTASGNTTSLATTSFTNFELTPFPAPWTNLQIGTVSVSPSVEYYGGVYTINGAGTLGAKADVSHFLSQTLTGDGEIIARLSSLQSTGANARFGVMIRDTTSAGSKNAFMGVSPDGTFRFQTRSANNGSTSTVTSGTGTAPNIWVKLVRTGSTFSGYKSSNGTSWTLVSSTTISMGSSIRIGLINGSGATNALNKSSADNVSVIP